MVQNIDDYLDREEVMTTDEAAAFLRVHRRTLYRLIKAGKLKAPLVGAHRRILKSEVLAYLRGETGLARPNPSGGQTVVNEQQPTPLYRTRTR